MIVVSICGDVELIDGDPITALERCAQRLGFDGDVSVERFDSPFELIERASSNNSESLADLILCGENMQGMSAMEVLADMHSAKTDGKPSAWASRTVAAPRFILAQRDAELAFDAAKLEADGFLVVPATSAALEQCLVRCLTAIKAEHGNSVVLRCQDGWCRILLDRVMYTQTSNHNQLIQFDDGTSLVTRATSQELFEKLSSGTSSFFKAGSSYIVNLTHISSMRSSGNTVTFGDGTSISVPSRSRTALERELLAN